MKRALFLVLAVCLVMPAIAGQQTAAELFNRGMLLERSEGNVAGAIALYEQIVSQFPNDKVTLPRALYRLGLGYEARKDPRAEEVFARLVKDFASSRLAIDARQRLSQSQTMPFKTRELGDQFHYGNAEFSLDGRLAVYGRFVDSKFHLCLRTLPASKETVLNDVVIQPLATLRLSPDARWVAVLDRARPASPPSKAVLSILEPTPNGRRLEIALAPFAMPRMQGLVNHMLWSPDSKWIPYVGPTGDPKVGEVRLWSSVTRESKSLGVQVDSITWFRWSPDGKRLAFRAKDKSKSLDELRVFTIATGESRTIAGPGLETDGKWTANDRLVVRRTTAGTPSTTEVFLQPASGGTAAKICTETSGGDVCGVSDDGRYVFRWSSETKSYFVRELPAGEERPLTRSPGEEILLKPSRDSRFVTFFSNRAGHWAAYVATLDRLPIDEPIRIADIEGAPGNTQTQMMMFDPAGALMLISSTQLGNVSRLAIDPATGRPAPGAGLERLTQDAPYNDRPAVSPDGKLIAYRYRTDTRSGIGVMTASGANERQLVTVPRNPNGYSPVWRSNEELLFIQPEGIAQGTTRWLASVNIATSAVTRLRQTTAVTWAYLRGRDEFVEAVDPADKVPVFRAVSLSTGVERFLTPSASVGDSLDGLVATADGKTIAYSVVGKLTQIRSMNTDGTGERTLLESKDMLYPVALSADGRFLLFDPTYGSETARVLNMATKESWELLKSWPLWDSEGSWAPDGSYFVVTTAVGLRTWRWVQGVNYEAVAKLMKR